MTFKEFFIKKKIDLDLLKQAEPTLYAEFEKHFGLMGEKSFDHTKKFWFNKLRKAYHLKETPKPGKEVIEETKIASQADPLRSPTIDQKPAAGVASTPVYPDTESKQPAPAFKPRFKPRNINVNKEETAAEESQKQEEAKITPASSVDETSASQTEEQKPVYKPRFKPRNITNLNKEEHIAEESQKQEETVATPASDIDGTPASSQSEEQKPVYKPRFKPRNIPPKQDVVKEESPLPETKDENITTDQAEPETPANKPAYKPRFNPKNIPLKKTDQAESTPKEESPAPEEPASGEAKPTYKPRFNMKNIKPKSEE